MSDQADGYQMVKSGEIAATVLIAGKPTGSFGKFKLEPGMTLLPVPYTEALEQDYFPSQADAARTTPTSSPRAAPSTPSRSPPCSPSTTGRATPTAIAASRCSSTPSSASSPSSRSRRGTPSGRRPISRATLRGWKRFPAAEEWLARNADKHGRRRAVDHRSGRRARAGGQGRAQRSGRAGAPVPAVHGVGQDAETLGVA